MKNLNIVKKVDLFAQPFSFIIGKEGKKKQTIFGGMVTVIIMSVSIIYLVYLLYLYFSNRFLPKLTSLSFNAADYQSLTFDEGLFGFQVTNQAFNLEDLEKQSGKQYLQYQLRFSQYSQIAEPVKIDIPLKRCGKDSIFEDYNCLDLEGLSPSVQTLFRNPRQLTTSNYELVVSECKGLANCATPQEIKDLIVNKDTTIFIKTNIKQYDVNSKQFKNTIKLEYYNFDDQLSVLSTFSLKRSSTTIDQGLFIQSQINIEHLIDYVKGENYFTQNNMLNKIGYDGYFQFSFEISQNYFETHIQFPMITEVLSQFMSIFNILLAVGVVARMFAETRIIEDFSSLLLKEYYKLTAIKLIYSNKQQAYPKLTSLNRKADAISLLQDEINDSNFVEKQNHTFKVSFIQRIKMLAFQLFSKVEEEQSSEAIIYKKMIMQTVEEIDIYQVYKDMIKLKMAIKLILSKDQYAALQYCGSELNISTNPFQQQTNSKEKDNNKIAKNQSDLGIQEIQSWNKEVEMLPQISNKECNEQVKGPNLDQTDQDLSIKINSLLKVDINQDPQLNPLQVVKINPIRKKENQKQDSNQQENNILNKNPQQNQNKGTSSLYSSTSKESPKEKIGIKCNLQNHLRELDEIINNKLELKNQLEIFIDKIQQQKGKLSQIDQNIYSSLIGNQEIEVQNSNFINLEAQL